TRFSRDWSSDVCSSDLSGRILEIEGLPKLKIEQAFEFSDASAERSAAGCTVKLDKEPIIEYLNSNITLMKWMIAEGYEDARTLEIGRASGRERGKSASV